MSRFLSNALVEGADIFARNHHAGQMRKNGREEYIEHPRRVARLVAVCYPDNPQMLAAALLHDTVEDTDATFAMISEVFGPKVTEYVVWLTDEPKTPHNNRAMRHQLNVRRLASAPAAAQTIKLADICDNLVGVNDLCPEFAARYLAEKADDLAVLTKGDPFLYSLAEALLRRALADRGASVSFVSPNQ